MEGHADLRQRLVGVVVAIEQPALAAPTRALASDAFGNSIWLAWEGSQPAVDDFAEGFLASQARVVNILSAAQSDPAPIVQAYAAMLQMFAESAQAPALARPYLERARAGLDESRASRRERQFVDIIGAWVDAQVQRCVDLLDVHVDEFGRDLVAIKLAQYHRFNLGQPRPMLRLGRLAQAAAPEVPYVHGMAAFAYEQCQMLAEAERSAWQGLELDRSDPWAHHALAHVYLTRGQFRHGSEFLHQMAPSWVGLNSFMLTHNWWHQALFQIELHDLDAALACYDQQVWGVDKRYSQDQIGAVSLLARLELAGVDVGARWQELAPWLARRTDDQVLAFLDLQYLYGLARAGRGEANILLGNIETRAASGDDSTITSSWREVALPAAYGLVAHARSDYRVAALQLGKVKARLSELGGSHAQRDLFERIERDARAHV